MKSHLLRKIALLVLVFSSQWANADVMVLVHGYLGDAHSWQRAGIVPQLNQAGWQHAGNLGFSYNGLHSEYFTDKAANKRYYTVQLPYKAPAMHQADWLQAMLGTIEARHPDEKITIIGHSAGGVIARLAIVRHGQGQVNRLITIAAPHLGTDKAIQALNATNNGGMFGFLKEWVVRDNIGDGLYNTVQQSRGILVDLLPPRPGTMLFWLNQQAHPDISYVSIIRAQGYQSRDLVVPPISQDMNRIYALAGKSQVVLSAQGHELTPQDGKLLLDLL